MVRAVFWLHEIVQTFEKEKLWRMPFLFFVPLGWRAVPSAAGFVLLAKAVVAG